jgi:ABC-type nitrate/sulfonate/bicarbonate transport system permease component
VRAFPVIAGLFALAGLWELIGRLQLFGTTWPALSAVVAYLAVTDHQTLLATAALRTGSEALAGLAIGSAAAIVLASLGVLVPAAAPGLGAFASLVNGIPVISIAGVCVLTLPRDVTPVVVAALAVAFIVFVAASSALATSSSTNRDLFTVLGASRLTTFMRLDVPGAIVGTVDGLRTAAPVAVVGAILGEWFAAEHGLGPLLVASMQNYAIEQLWATTLAGALLSVILYSLLGGVRAVVGARLA